MAPAQVCAVIHRGPQDPLETRTARRDSGRSKTACAFDPGANFAGLRRCGDKAGGDSGAAGADGADDFADAAAHDAAVDDRIERRQSRAQPRSPYGERASWERTANMD